MRDLKVSFEKLEGDSFESGQIVLKAVFETRSVIIKTTYKQLTDLQENLALQLGKIYTDRFQFITLEQLQEFGGVLIDFFFDDALQCEFITHNDHFKLFFSSAQKIQNNEEKKMTIDDSMRNINQQDYYQREIQNTQMPTNIKKTQQEKEYQINKETSNRMADHLYDYDNSKNAYQFQFPEKKQFQSSNFYENFEQEGQEDLFVYEPISYFQKIKGNIKNPKSKNIKKINPQENIYLNNRQLLEEKIHNDRKYIRFSKYFRRKVKQKLKFLFMHRQNLKGQMILNCFKCYKCHKDMYFGIRCFKCRREDAYYCEDCNTKCPTCLVLLKKTNDHVNINNFYKLMSKTLNTCQACLESIPLIKYDDHLYQCEDNIEECKYCKVRFHFSALKEHLKNQCEQKPVICQICNAKYPKFKQTSHKCIQRFYTVHNQLNEDFLNIKSVISNKFSNLEDKLKQLQYLTQSNKSFF